MAGTLILCGSPIGNLGDAVPRLAAAIESADIVYCEDTRRTRTLLDHLGVRAPMRSYFAGNEDRRSRELGERLQAGETVALVTDAGMPGVSDPGWSAVQAAIEAGALVTGVPGASAVTLALAVSGLPTDRFVFEGFLPRKGRKRRERLTELSSEPRTMVLFAAATRLVTDLADLASELGEERRCVVCRELTKAHEEVWRGRLAEAAQHWDDTPPRGEVTLIVAGMEVDGGSLDEAATAALQSIDGGTRPSEAVRRTATEFDVSRRDLYDEVRRLRE